MTKGKKNALLLLILLVGGLSLLLLLFPGRIGEFFESALFRGATPQECETLETYVPKNATNNSNLWKTHVVLVRDFNAKIVEDPTGDVTEVDTKLNQDEAVHFCNEYKNFIDTIDTLTNGQIQVKVEKVIDYQERTSSLAIMKSRSAGQKTLLNRYVLTPKDLGYPTNPKLNFRSGEIDNIVLAYNAGTLNNLSSTRINGATHTFDTYRFTKAAIPITVPLLRRDATGSKELSGILAHEFIHSLEYALGQDGVKLELFHDFLVRKGYVGDQGSPELIKEYFEEALTKKELLRTVSSATESDVGYMSAQNIEYTFTNKGLDLAFTIDNPWQTKLERILVQIFNKETRKSIASSTSSSPEKGADGKYHISIDETFADGAYIIQVAIIDSKDGRVTAKNTSKTLKPFIIGIKGNASENFYRVLEPERIAPNIIDVTNMRVVQDKIEVQFTAFIPDSYIESGIIKLKYELLKGDAVVKTDIVRLPDTREEHPEESLFGHLTIPTEDLYRDDYTVKIYVKNPKLLSEWYNYAESKPTYLATLPEDTTSVIASSETVTTTNTGPATDVPLAHPAATYIDEVKNNALGVEIMSGDPNGKFRPDDPLNRAEIAKIAIALREAKSMFIPMNESQKTFNDVNKGTWYFPYVEQAFSAGIVSGDKDRLGNLLGIYRPADYVTRAEALKIILEATGYQDQLHSAAGGDTIGYSDIPQSAWYVPHVATAAQEGILLESTSTDTCQTCFYPERPITRGEVATLIAKTGYLK